jgi:hypothetical protein
MCYWSLLSLNRGKYRLLGIYCCHRGTFGMYTLLILCSFGVHIVWILANLGYICLILGYYEVNLCISDTHSFPKQPRTVTYISQIVMYSTKWLNNLGQRPGRIGLAHLPLVVLLPA